jgi:hypothetical protein
LGLIIIDVPEMAVGQRMRLLLSQLKAFVSDKGWTSTGLAIFATVTEIGNVSIYTTILEFIEKVFDIIAKAIMACAHAGAGRDGR